MERLEHMDRILKKRKEQRLARERNVTLQERARLEESMKVIRRKRKKGQALTE